MWKFKLISLIIQLKNPSAPKYKIIISLDHELLPHDSNYITKNLNHGKRKSENFQ